jgi:hypothetical protein
MTVGLTGAIVELMVAVDMEMESAPPAVVDLSSVVSFGLSCVVGSDLL